MDLIIVGHLGVNDNETPFGRALSPGGSAYGVAMGARLLGPGRVGLVSVVGPDYDPSVVTRLGVDVEGLVVREGRSPRFHLRQHADGRRTFAAEMGTAGIIAPDRFPRRYRDAAHIHVATAPPEQQLAWLRFAGGLCPRPTVSVDMFESFAIRAGDLCRRVCDQADLLFMNADEQRILFEDRPVPGVPTVVKLGPRGALYRRPGRACRVGTVSQRAVDTTGAGEVLAGVFLAMRMAGHDPCAALSAAVRAATAKVTQFGVDGQNLAEVLRATPVWRSRVEAPGSGVGVPGLGW